MSTRADEWLKVHVWDHRGRKWRDRIEWEAMMKTIEQQMNELSEGLPTAAVKKREGPGGKTLSYVDGVWVIEELNRIFGFDAWSDETVSLERAYLERVTKKRRDGSTYEASVTYYEARVRLKVRFADGTQVVREDTGSGNGEGPTAGEACEKASKEAVTDALKRCARKLGNRFGLSLYDRANPLHQGGEDSHADETEKPSAANDTRKVPDYAKQIVDYRKHFERFGERGTKVYADAIFAVAESYADLKPEQIGPLAQTLRAKWSELNKASQEAA